MTRLPLLLVSTAIVGWACTASPGPGDPFVPHDGSEGEGVIGEWVHSGGFQREYLMSLPPVLDEAGRYPLLIVMHGAGADADGLHRWISPDSSTEAAGFIAVYPTGLDQSWNIGCPACTSAAARGVDDVRFLHTLIDHLADSLPIDPERVFLAGHSLGAQFVHFYACTSTRPPTAIAAFSGLWLRRTAVDCRPAGDVGVMMVHGDRDRILPWDGPRRNASALSMPEAWERWYEINDCSAARIVEERPDAAGDGTTVETARVGGCRGGTTLELHRLRGAGHGWPGPVAAAPPLGPHTDNFDGVAEMVRFFSQYVR